MIKYNNNKVKKIDYYNLNSNLPVRAVTYNDIKLLHYWGGYVDNNFGGYPFGTAGKSGTIDSFMKYGLEDKMGHSSSVYTTKEKFNYTIVKPLAEDEYLIAKVTPSKTTTLRGVFLRATLMYNSNNYMAFCNSYKTGDLTGGSHILGGIGIWGNTDLNKASFLICSSEGKTLLEGTIDGAKKKVGLNIYLWLGSDEVFFQYAIGDTVGDPITVPGVLNLKDIFKDFKDGLYHICLNLRVNNVATTNYEFSVCNC